MHEDHLIDGVIEDVKLRHNFASSFPKVHVPFRTFSAVCRGQP
jgi:hypothetical protein